MPMICELVPGLVIGTPGRSSLASVKRLRRPALTRALKLLMACFSGGVTTLVPPTSMLRALMGRPLVVPRISLRLVRLMSSDLARCGTRPRVLDSCRVDCLVRTIRLLVVVSVPVSLRLRFDAVLAMRHACFDRLGTLATP